MSEAKGKEQAVKTAEQVVKPADRSIVKTGSVVYMGPSIKNVMQEGTVFTNGYPEKVKAYLEAHPIAKELIVATSQMAAVKKELRDVNSARSIFYEKMKGEL